jgi:hypothetical protein
VQRNKKYKKNSKQIEEYKKVLKTKLRRIYNIVKKKDRGYWIDELSEKRSIMRKKLKEKEQRLLTTWRDKKNS